MFWDLFNRVGVRLFLFRIFVRIFFVVGVFSRDVWSREDIERDK